jgi:hypothetical protein
MCFSMAWFQQLLIYLVIVCAIVGIFKILIPFALSKLGATLGEGANVVLAVLRIIVWAIVVIFVIYICFALISCLLSYGGGMPLFPRGR